MVVGVGREVEEVVVAGNNTGEAVEDSILPSF